MSETETTTTMSAGAGLALGMGAIGAIIGVCIAIIPFVLLCVITHKVIKIDKKLKTSTSPSKSKTTTATDE